MDWTKFLFEFPKLLESLRQSITTGSNPSLSWLLLFLLLYVFFRPGDLTGKRKGGLFYRDFIVAVDLYQKHNILIWYGLSYWTIQLFLLLGFCVSFSPWYQAMPAIGGTIVFFGFVAMLSHLFRSEVRTILFKLIRSCRKRVPILRRFFLISLIMLFALIIAMRIQVISGYDEQSIGKHRISSGNLVLVDFFQDYRERNDEWLKTLDAPWKPSCQENWRLKHDKRYKEFLEKCPNDYEARIYLNNQQALESASNTPESVLNLIVAVPISRDSGRGVFPSMEFLKGIALGQQDINSSGGIQFGNKSTFLQVYIIDDGDYDHIPGEEPREALRVANTISSMVNKKNIIAIIGPVTSDSVEAAWRIYRRHGLVSISPASTAMRTSGFLRMINTLPAWLKLPNSNELNLGPNVFRVAPNDKHATEQIRNYIIRYNERAGQGRIRKIAVVYQYDNRYGKLYKNIFNKVANEVGISLANRDDQSTDSCAIDLSNKSSLLRCKKLIIREEADALFLVPSAKSAPDLRDFAKDLLGSVDLMLFGADSMYNSSWLEEPFAGMVVVAPNRKLNNKDESWRTAMAYDAIQALTRGITNISTSRQCYSYQANYSMFTKCIRGSLEKTLIAKGFIANGALGPSSVEFDTNGDRAVDRNSTSNNDYKDKLEGLYCVRQKQDRLFFVELGESDIC
jgi:ABC-type branched-subunit amino acid transport system substrate-binding protein